MQENTRTQRTYDLLLQALTELLTEKTFDEIRVTDLCEKAGIHRSTFYAHFEDKRHLLTFGIQELMDIFLVALPSAADPDAFRRALYRIFKYFLKNKHEYTMLFLDPRNASAKQLFHTEFVRAFRGVLKEKAQGGSPHGPDPVQPVLHRRPVLGDYLVAGNRHQHAPGPAGGAVCQPQRRQLPSVLSGDGITHEHI